MYLCYEWNVKRWLNMMVILYIVYFIDEQDIGLNCYVDDDYTRYDFIWSIYIDYGLFSSLHDDVG